jgi:hypothetical protein
VDDEGLGTTRVRLPIEQQAIVEHAIAKALPAVPESSAGDKTPIAQRRADALVLVCESFLAAGASPKTRSGAARNNAVVHVELDRDGVTGGVSDAGVPVHPETCRRLLCDSRVEGMLGDLDTPIGTGRAKRTVNRAQRRALDKRSGRRCEFTGCTSTLFLEAHHVWEWANGGPSDLWNLAHLCWHHHHLVHDGGYRLVHDGHGGITCYRPDGTELTDPIPTMPSSTLDLDLALEAIVPLWAGERFDLSAAVDAVLWSKHGLMRTGRSEPLATSSGGVAH